MLVQEACPEGGERTGTAVGGCAPAKRQQQPGGARHERIPDRFAEPDRAGRHRLERVHEPDAARRGQFDDCGSIRQHEPFCVDGSSIRSGHGEAMPPSRRVRSVECEHCAFAAVGHRHEDESVSAAHAGPAGRQRMGDLVGRRRAFERVGSHDDGHAHRCTLEPTGTCSANAAVARSTTSAGSAAQISALKISTSTSPV